MNTRKIKAVELKLFHNDGLSKESRPRVSSDGHKVFIEESFDFVIVKNFQEYMRKAKQSGFFEVPKIGESPIYSILIPVSKIYRIEKCIDIRD